MSRSLRRAEQVTGRTCLRGVVRLLLLVATVSCMAGAGHSLAETRVALVVGNGRYASVPVLRNAVADARAMRDQLTASGFEVVYREDADRRTMNRAVEEFIGKLSTDSVALFYYAGHGVQIGAANYLIPTDIRAASAGEVADDAVDLTRVLERVTATQVRFALAIVDACRDNPFRVAGRSVGGSRGLAPTTTADGVMVIYSAGANQTALDSLSDRDTDPNGLFTREWLKAMRVPGRNVQAMVGEVRRSVAAMARSVGHVQTPAVYDQSLGTFEFVPASSTAAALPATQPQPISGHESLQARTSVDGRPPDAAPTTRTSSQVPSDALPTVPGTARAGAPVGDCDLLAQPPRRQLAPLPAPVEGVATDELDSRAGLDACARAATTWPDEPRFLANAARIAGKIGNEPEEARLYRFAADRGNAFAQLQLGSLLTVGRPGLEQDLREAAKYFRLAADQGLAAAQDRLASMYLQGQGGLPQDDREAARLWRLAAAAGNDAARRNLQALEGRRTARP